MYQTFTQAVQLFHHNYSCELNIRDYLVTGHKAMISLQMQQAIRQFTHSFIHSYSFIVQVDITQLQTDREARKEDRIYIYAAVIVTNQIVMYSYFYIAR